MPRVRVKVPVEPKIIEYASAQTRQVSVAYDEPVQPVAVAEQTMDEAPQPTSAEIVQTAEPIAAMATPQAVFTQPNTNARGITLTPKMVALIGVTILVVFLFTIGIVRKGNSKNGATGTLGASTSNITEADRYYQEVSKYVELPVGELPTVANISDADKVKAENAVLGDIKNGDKMMFFTKSRKVVVYRPSTKKVVVVVSLAAPGAQNTGTSTSTQSTSPPVRN